MIFALPKQAIQAFVAAAKLGWKPAEYVTSVSIDPAVMQIVQLSAGTQTSASARRRRRSSTTRRTRRRSDSAGVKLYLQIMKRYLPNEDPKAVAHIYGMMAAYAMVDALKHAGKNPTRAGLLQRGHSIWTRRTRSCCRAQAHDDADDYFPIGQTYLVRYLHGFWNVLGKPLNRPSFAITDRKELHL